MQKRLISSVILFVFTVSILAGCSDNSENTAVSVTAERCDSYRITQRLNVSGTVELEDAGVFTVSSKLKNYRIKSINIRKGDEINEGDIICEFDTSEAEKQIKDIEERLSRSQSRDEQNIKGIEEKINIQNSLLEVKLEQIEENRNTDQVKYDQAVQNYNSVKSELENLEAEYSVLSEELLNSPEKEQSSELSRYEELVQKIETRRSEAETLRMTVSDLKSRLDDYPYQERITRLETESTVAELQLSADSYLTDNDLEEQLKELKVLLENSVVYAPCSGVVRDVNITSGQIWTTESLVTIVQMDKTVVRTVLTDYDSVLVKEGMGVEITAGTENYTGRVSRLCRIKSEEGFDALIELNEAADINIGLTVSNSIKLFDDEVVSVRKSALINDDGSYYVYVAVPQDDGTYTAEYKPVTVGVQDEKNAEICSGISIGDLVILDDSGVVSDGLTVDVSVIPEDE